MIEVRQTETFRVWHAALNDRRAAARIAIRIDRMALGNAGDVKSVGDGVHEMRIDYGPGYRVYFSRRGAALTILLCGGDKRAQSADIAPAKVLAGES
jgi:putative addiction module killer protein